MIPPSELVGPLELVSLPCRFCNDVVTRELRAEAATFDARALVSADLLSARLVSNWVYAAVKLDCTLPDEDWAEVGPSSLTTPLFSDCRASVVNADTAAATELAVVCVGAVGPAPDEVPLAGVAPLLAALYSAAKLAA